MKPTGKIIPLAFPDTYVRYSDESILFLLPILGIGKKNYLKAGHAAFVLIENETGNAEYYDFGRYITPEGYGRVRSAVTDTELEIPFKMIINNNGSLKNIEELLLWLEAHPEKTHGSGRLIASICDEIDYDKAKSHVIGLQNKGSIPYKAFGKIGTNCSRIVTDTILASTSDRKIIKGLTKNKRFTPSPLGNVGKSSKMNPIYQINDGVIGIYDGSIFKENLTNYFHKDVPIATCSKKEREPFKDAHFLHGTGSSAYFRMEETDIEGEYLMIRYTATFEEDFRGIFQTDDIGFNFADTYEFTYDSNCSFYHVLQNGKKIRFNRIKDKITLN